MCCRVWVCEKEWHFAPSMHNPNRIWWPHLYVSWFKPNGKNPEWRVLGTQLFNKIGGWSLCWRRCSRCWWWKEFRWGRRAGDRLFAEYHVLWPRSNWLWGLHHRRRSCSNHQNRAKKQSRLKQGCNFLMVVRPLFSTKLFADFLTGSIVQPEI